MRSSPDQGGRPGAGKIGLRRRLLDARAARSPEDRAATTVELANHVISLASGGTGPVGCYLPTGSEPGAAGSGSVTVADLLLDAGHEVLVPVVPAEPEPLDWARHTGPGGPVRGPLGVPEPTGDRLGADAVRQVRLLLVPALAVDRRGRRLGRGGGYYDRTLPLLGTGTTTAALLHDDEFLDEVPAEPHDAPVGAVVLPRAGTVRLPVPASTRERT